jgi:membrane-associated phospholipid phosphatase
MWSHMAMNALDWNLLEFVAAHRTRAVTWFARGAMNAGSSTIVLAALALFGLVYVVWRRRPGLAVAVVGAVVAAMLLSTGLKMVIERPRPRHPPALVHPAGYAMPSTHAADTAAAAVAAWLSLTQLGRPARRVAGAALGVAVVVVGFCMVYLGAHWASDVVVGWALGAAVGLGAARLVAQGWLRSPATGP